MILFREIPWPLLTKLLPPIDSLDPRAKLEGRRGLSVACHSLPALLFSAGEVLREAITLHQSPGKQVLITIAVTLISNTVPIRLRAFVPLSK